MGGYDEFFHFYGAEDVDLFDRIERAGYKRKNIRINYFIISGMKVFRDRRIKSLLKNQG